MAGGHFDMHKTGKRDRFLQMRMMNNDKPFSVLNVCDWEYVISMTYYG